MNPTDPKEFRPGIYEHYKGGIYLALMLVEHHETREPYVVYVSIGHRSLNIRPWAKHGEDSWTDQMVVVNVVNGDTVPRFRFLG